MKLTFDHKDNFLVIHQKERDANKIVIILSAQNHQNNKSSIVNSVEITKEQFIELIAPLGFEIKEENIKIEDIKAEELNNIMDKEIKLADLT